MEPAGIEPATSDLPDRHVVWSIVEDHENRDLLFVGTELGLFFTVDGGLNWIQLKSGAPPAAFRDLVIQRRESDLVAATFGRGLYVLDDYTALRHLTAENLSQDASLFRPRDALVYNELRYIVAAFGNTTMPNPPFGATLSYYLSEGFASDDNGKIVLSIRDTRGEPVRQITGPTTSGLHRVQWDLRRDPKLADNGEPEPRSRRGGQPSGPLVEPGTYMVTLIRVIDGKETVLGKTQAIRVRPL